MTKNNKKIIFFVCCALFVILAPTVLFYCQGYRFDFETKKIVKTGAFYFKVLPRQAQVYLNGKIQGKSDFFFGAILIENLLPKNYKVKIERQDYQSWEKNLTVNEAETTEAKNIVLPPEKLSFDLLSQQVMNFWFSPDGKKIIFQEKSIGTEKNGESWNLALFNLENRTKTPLVDRAGADILDLRWSAESERIIVTLKTRELGKDGKIVKEQESSLLITLPLLTVETKTDSLSLKEGDAPYFSPNNQKFLFSRKNKNNLFTLYESDFGGRFPKIVLDNLLAFEISGRNIYWLAEDGSLEKSSFDGQTQTISLRPLSLKENVSYQIKILASKIFISEEKRLFFFDDNTGNFSEIAANVDHFLISPEGKKLCFWNEFEAGIFFLEEETSQLAKKAGEKIFLTRFSEKVDDFFWWSEYYLIFRVENTLKFIETDDRDHLQIWGIAKFSEPKVYLNFKERKLYILSGGDLFSSNRF